MEEIQPLQPVNTEAEKFALSIAPFVKAGDMLAAQRALIDFAAEKDLKDWEVIAVADIAKAMAAGRKWKKDTIGAVGVIVKFN